MEYLKNYFKFELKIIYGTWFRNIGDYDLFYVPSVFNNEKRRFNFFFFGDYEDDIRNYQIYVIYNPNKCVFDPRVIYGMQIGSLVGKNYRYTKSNLYFQNMYAKVLLSYTNLGERDEINLLMFEIELVDKFIEIFNDLNSKEGFNHYYHNFILKNSKWYYKKNIAYAVCKEIELYIKNIRKTELQTYLAADEFIFRY